jgi:hypothetical protein
VRKADNLTAIFEPIVQIMWNPQHLTTLYASTACYGDSFALLSKYLSGINLKNHGEHGIDAVSAEIRNKYVQNIQF